MKVAGDDACDAMLSAVGFMPVGAVLGGDPPTMTGPELPSGCPANRADNRGAEVFAVTSSVDPGRFRADVNFNYRILCKLEHNRMRTVDSISIQNVCGDKPGKLTASVTPGRGVSDCPADKPSETIVERQAAGQRVTIERPSHLLDDVTLGALDEASPATLCLALQTGERATAPIECPIDVIAKRKIGQAIVDQVRLKAQGGSSPSERLGAVVRYIDGLVIEPRGPIEPISSLGPYEGPLGGCVANVLRPRAYV